MRPAKELPARKTLQLLTLPLLPLVIVGGHFYPMLGFLAVAMMLVMLVSSIFRGRYYCGWLCAMGAFHERALALLSRNRPLLPVMKAGWFRWLVLALMMTILSLRLLQADGNPARIGATFVMMWTLSTALAVGLGLIWQPRSWCQICPMATFQGLAGPCSYLLTVSASCRDCGICRKACPIATNPADFHGQGFVPSGECMRCGNCIASCPTSALAFQRTPRRGCSALAGLGLKTLPPTLREP